MKTNRIYILFPILLLSACIYTSTFYEEKIFFIRLNNSLSDQSKIDLSIQAGEVATMIGDNNEQKIYKVKFYKVDGGETLFMGQKIKVSDGYAAKRLKIKNQEKEIATYSINDLLKQAKIKLDSFEVIEIGF
jgi:hypothetical protein